MDIIVHCHSRVRFGGSAEMTLDLKSGDPSSSLVCASTSHALHRELIGVTEEKRGQDRRGTSFMESV